MSELNAIIESYGQLEIEMRQCMQQVCEMFCGRCQTTCCRPVYCRESLDSPFLAEVRRRFAPGTRWDAALGWLTPTGCGLVAGRPPVCYEFLCRTILDAQPSPQARFRLEALAVLLTDAGRRAAGQGHLVEMTDLDRINAGRLTKQLAQARSFLDDLRKELRLNQS
ncbi:MAG: hypothetical protein HY911_08565 [Desulfobacterales bacterium]|nr:hypothetical protein [Desulfobacterales bacterium]